MDFNLQQMKEDSLIKEGRYKFVVKDAREKRSANGNDMLNLKLIINSNGRDVIYWTSLILLPKMFWMIEHFCMATGLDSKLQEGRLMAQDCLDKEGYIDIIQKQNQQTGELENQTKDFVKRQDLADTQKNDTEFFDDPIPDFK